MKARALTVKCGVTYEAGPGQFWQKNESGKRWELWDTSTGLLRRVTYLDSKRVMWVEPESLAGMVK